MEKNNLVFYIAPGLFINTQGKILKAEFGGTVVVKIIVDQFLLLGIIQFHNCPPKGVDVKLSITGTYSEAIPFPSWQTINNRILQQYKGIADVLGNAFLSGFFNED